MMRRITGAYILCLTLVACNVGNGESGSEPLISKIGGGNYLANSAINSSTPLIEIRKANGVSYCTGTLIDTDKVITAAHCVLELGNNFKKNYGEPLTSQQKVPELDVKVIFPKNLNTPIDLTKQTTVSWNLYSIKNIFIHKDSFWGAQIVNGEIISPANYDFINDLCILELANNVDPKYKVVSLASANPTIGTSEISAGFGETSAAFSFIAMNHSIGKVINISNDRVIFLGVAGYCPGDSGGPDFVMDPSRELYLTGVHSFGATQAECNNPQISGVSMSVPFYSEWIKNGYRNYHL